MKNKLTKVLFSGLFMLVSASSYADIGLGGGVVGGLGMTLPSSGSSIASYAIGGRVTYSLSPMLRLAGEWVYQNATPSAAPTGYTANFSDAVVSADYVFAGMIDGLYVGPKVGVGFSSAGGVVSSTFTFGAEAGYDYKIGPITVGPQLNYLYVLAPTGGTAFSVFQALAAVKFWL